MKARDVFVLLAALAMHGAVAQELAGTWQGKLQVDPQTELNLHFVITARPEGGYAAVLTSPDTGAIKDVAASAVAFADGKLDIEVEALSGAYSGVLANGVIEGEWSQEGATLPLVLRPYSAPVLSAADIEALRGVWSGKLTPAPTVELTIVFRFEVDDAGALQGTVESLQGGSSRAPLTDIVLEDGEFSVKQPAARLDYTGRLEGERIVGEWRQLGRAIPLTLTKGEVEVPVLDLELPAAAREALAGRWRGTLGPLTIVIRFETDAEGRSLGFLDSPDQGASGIPIGSASLEDGKLTFEVPGVFGRYSGELADGTITGEWTQGAMTSPLTLARE